MRLMSVRVMAKALIGVGRNVVLSRSPPLLSFVTVLSFDDVDTPYTY